MVLSKFPSGETHNPKIYYVGVFDYKKLIKTMADWFTTQGYEFREKVFKHKVPTPAGTEQEFTFEGWIKTTEYVMYWIYVKGHIWEMKEVNVVVDGEKKRMIRGKVQLTLSCDCWLDYNNKFNTPMTARIQTFLHHHVLWKQITGSWTDEVYYRMFKLHRELKEALNMSTTTNASHVRY